MRPEKKEAWKEVYFHDLPEVGKISKNTLKAIKEKLHRFSGSVRVQMGRIWTDEEWEEYRSKVLKTPLP